jgi:hypothetical protein
MLTIPGVVPPESMLHKYGESSALWFYLKGLGWTSLFFVLCLAAIGIFFFKSWGRILFIISNVVWGVITTVFFLFELFHRRPEYFIQDGLYIPLFFIVWYFGASAYLTSSTAASCFKTQYDEEKG